MQTDRQIYALEIYGPCAEMPICAGPIDRYWMDVSPDRSAYRCLPLTIANQSGWIIHNPRTFIATWDGGPYRQNVRIDFESATPCETIASHFGSGVVTFSLPYLFRTPPGVNLWVKGPANVFKDGVQALEGVVETDWLPATFTMNWKLTRPLMPVEFRQGEPMCMIVPVSRSLIESLDPILAPLQTFPALASEFEAWGRSRTEFNQALEKKLPQAVERGWQRDYVKGLTPNGQRAPNHQSRLQVKEFHRLEEAPKPVVPQP